MSFIIPLVFRQPRFVHLPKCVLVLVNSSLLVCFQKLCLPLPRPVAPCCLVPSVHLFANSNSLACFLSPSRKLPNPYACCCCFSSCIGSTSSLAVLFASSWPPPCPPARWCFVHSFSLFNFSTLRAQLLDTTISLLLRAGFLVPTPYFILWFLFSLTGSWVTTLAFLKLVLGSFPFFLFSWPYWVLWPTATMTLLVFPLISWSLLPLCFASTFSW